MALIDTLTAALSSAFLRPLGLAALAAAIPIVLLYLLKPNPTRVAFPAVEFLLGDREERRRHPALRRLQRSALLLFQLLVVVAVAVSLAAPYVPVSEQRTVEETVVVVDASASMATESGGRTRFSRAISSAKGALTAENSVVVAGGDASVPVRRAPKTAAATALDELRVTGLTGDLSGAIGRAAAVAGDDARIVVASDFADDGWRTAVSAARARGYAVSLRQFDGGGEGNVGVVDRSFANGTVSVRVKNFGDGPAERRVSLGGASRSLALAPGGVASATLPVPAGGGRLRLNPGDSVPVDDELPVAAPDDPTVDVLVLTNDADRPLVTALSVVRGTDVTVENPPASVSESYDLVVFSAVEPGALLDGTRQLARDTLARGGGVVVQAQSNLSAVDYGGLLPLAPNGTARNPALGQPAASPLTADVTFPAPETYVRGDLRAGTPLLQTTNGTALLATASVENGRVLYYGYPPEAAAFERSYRYPVFWKRAVYELTGRRALSELNRRTGDRLRFGGNATVDTPAGSRAASAVTLRRVGFYEGGGERYAASLTSLAESNVTASPVAASGSGGTGAGTETERVPRPLTAFAAAFAVCAVLLELGFLRYRGDLLMDVPGFEMSLTFARPLALGALPVVAVALWALVVRRSGGAADGSDAGDDSTTGPGRRTRVALFASRFLVVTCLVVAAAGPTTVTTATTTSDPSVTVLVDESASMGVYPSVAEDLEAAVEAEGVAVERVTVAAGNRSRVGDGVVANLRPNGSVLVVSDGQATGGASLARATDLARSINATVNRVTLTANRSDARVTVAGPEKATVGVENTFLVRVAGVERAPTDGTVTVTVDGEQVASRAVPDSGRFTVAHNFSSVGPHRVTARVTGGGAFAVNDAFRKTVEVVEQPSVLYVSRDDYPLEGYLRQLYDVTRADSVPDDLSDYYAVVVQDVAAPDLGSVGALQDHVIGGGGLVVVGGENAYDRGGYGDSRLSSLLPVSVGRSTGQRSQIVLAVDVSGSAQSGMRVQKALALDVLSQLGDRNDVGLVAFNQDAYAVTNRTLLGDSRARLKRDIRSLESGGGTDIGGGLLGASGLLGDRGGTVVLLSDGRDSSGRAFAAADRLAERDVRVVTVGVGRVNGKVMRGVADRTGGSFLLANETSRLRVRFGGPNRRYSGDHAVVVDDSHFITRGVEPTASLPGVNEVSVKRGARTLVATGYGAPALSTWRFGLGRVASVTGYGADGSLGNLRSQPNSILLSRSVNWAIGDPQRKATGVVAARDTRVGEPGSVVYAGETAPDASANVAFSEVAPGRYEASPVPTERGYETVLDSEYAVNYRSEYAALGVSTPLRTLVEQTGGRAFAPGAGAAIADAVRRQTAHRQQIERKWDWALLVAALVVFVGEVCARRLGRHRGQGVIP